MNRLLIDAGRYRLFALTSEVREAAEYDGDKRVGQARDKDTGLPLWTAEVLFMTDEAGGTARVKFPAHEAPTLKPMQPVKIEGLVANVVRGNVYFAARSLEPAERQPAKG